MGCSYFYTPFCAKIAIVYNSRSVKVLLCNSSGEDCGDAQQEASEGARLKLRSKGKQCYW